VVTKELVNNRQHVVVQDLREGSKDVQEDQGRGSGTGPGSNHGRGLKQEKAVEPHPVLHEAVLPLIDVLGEVKG
jgi:hypothetical protein